MRYHEGLGIGHVHTHQPSASGIPHEPRDIDVSDKSSDIDVSNDSIPEQLPGGGDMQAPDITAGNHRCFLKKHVLQNMFYAF